MFSLQTKRQKSHHIPSCLVEPTHSGVRQGHTGETQLELKVSESSGSDFSASKMETGPFTNPPPLSSPQTMPHKTALFLRHTHKHANECTHSPLHFLPFHSTNYLLSQHFWPMNSTRTSWWQHGTFCVVSPFRPDWTSARLKKSQTIIWFNSIPVIPGNLVHWEAVVEAKLCLLHYQGNIIF